MCWSARRAWRQETPKDCKGTGHAADHKLFSCRHFKRAVPYMQVGAGGIKSLAAAKAPMSMGEILDVLVSKARLEAEDAKRVLLGALNGLAALMLLEDGTTQKAMAIKTYREVRQGACKVVENTALALSSLQSCCTWYHHSLSKLAENSSSALMSLQGCVT